MRGWGWVSASALLPVLAAGTLASFGCASAHAAVPRPGWRYVVFPPPIPALDATITGLAWNGDTLTLEAAVSVPTPSGIATHTWLVTGRAGIPRPGSLAAASYQGPDRLIFSSTFPHNFAPIPVRLEAETPTGHQRFVPWPRAVHVYGSAATPENAAPGSSDSAILGQTGNWLWVALKGPQHPPLYPHQGPLTALFRYWNRLLAINVVTDRYRLYPIPANYTYADFADAWLQPHPVWLAHGDAVFVAVGSWLGVFPATPSATGAPIVRAAPAWVIAATRHGVLTTLQRLYWQEAGSLAAFWDSVVGVSVPGLPRYQAGSTPPAWNADPVIENNGVFPAGLTWALTYPAPPETPWARTRRALGQAIVGLLTSQLNKILASPVVTPYPSVKRAFGGRPPFPLPGFTVRDKAYWPEGATTFRRVVAPIPERFRTPAAAVRAVSPLLAFWSPVPPLLPRHAASGFPPLKGRESVQAWYGFNRKPVPQGYWMTLVAGSSSPGSEPNGLTTPAGWIWTAIGLPSGRPLPNWMAWTKLPPVPRLRRTLRLGPRVAGIAGPEGPQFVVEWSEAGFRWAVVAPAKAAGAAVASAREDAARLSGFTALPLTHGYGVFRAHRSCVVVETAAATYVVAAPGSSAAAWATVLDWS